MTKIYCFIETIITTFSQQKGIIYDGLLKVINSLHWKSYLQWWWGNLSHWCGANESENLFGWKNYVWLGAHPGGKEVLTILCFDHNSRYLILLVDGKSYVELLIYRSG